MGSNTMTCPTCNAPTPSEALRFLHEHAWCLIPEDTLGRLASCMEAYAQQAVAKNSEGWKAAYDEMKASFDASSAETTAKTNEANYLRELANKQRGEIENLHGMADSAECLRDIGRLVGCDHVDDPDGRRQLVNCVERALNGEPA